MKTIENFYDNNPSFESNPRVNKPLMLQSLVNIINSALNNVKQNNVASAAALGASMNTLILIGLNATNLTIQNITQNANADVVAEVKSAQENVSNIINSMNNNISQKIINQSNISDAINQINNNNINALQAILNKKSLGNYNLDAGSLINAFFSGDPNSTKNLTPDMENNLKNLLGIDNSTQITSNSNTNNEIANAINNANYAGCNATAIANNTLALLNANVSGNITIDTITQNGKANLNLNCAFNQKSISNISNNIVNNISTTIDNLYKGANNKDPTNYDLLDALGGAISDKIIGASGILPANNSLQTNTPYTGTTQGNTSTNYTPNTPTYAGTIQQPITPIQQNTTPNYLSQIITPLNIGICLYICCLIIFIIILLIFFMSRSEPNNLIIKSDN